MNKQSFKGNVGHVAGRVDVRNMYVKLGEISASNDDPPLVPAQRKQLNQLISRLAEVSGQEKPIVWLSLHAELGVDSVGSITRSQYPKAVAFLDERLALEQEATTCRALISSILTLANAKGARQTMADYCKVTFGSSHLKALPRAQLQQLLQHIHTLSDPGAAQTGWRALIKRLRAWF